MTSIQNQSMNMA